jgi:hypothetical protein
MAGIDFLYPYTAHIYPPLSTPVPRPENATIFRPCPIPFLHIHDIHCSMRRGSEIPRGTPGTLPGESSSRLLSTPRRTATHTYAYALTHAHPQLHALIHMHALTHILTYARTHRHAQAGTHAYMYAHAHTDARTDTRKQGHRRACAQRGTTTLCVILGALESWTLLSDRQI